MLVWSSRRGVARFVYAIGVKQLRLAVC